MKRYTLYEWEEGPRFVEEPGGEWVPYADALAALEQERKDAERYRWLRENVYKEDGRLRCVGPIITTYEPFGMREELDAAIDSAMKAESETHSPPRT